MDAMVQLNVRMRQSLRDEGNEALKRRGISPSGFIRSVWERLASRGRGEEDLLAAVYAPEDDASEVPTRSMLFDAGQSLFDTFLQDVGIGKASLLDAYANRSYQDMREDALLERWAERGLLDGG